MEIKTVKKMHYNNTIMPNNHKYLDILAWSREKRWK